MLQSYAITVLLLLVHDDMYSAAVQMPLRRSSLLQASGPSLSSFEEDTAQQHLSQLFWA